MLYRGITGTLKRESDFFNSLPNSCFNNYRPYVGYLEGLISETPRSDKNNSAVSDSIHRALNGEASSQLRKIAEPELLRKDGVFFTGSELSQSSLAPALESCNEQSKILDPACGVGDLLMACANKLPLKESFEETLQQWGGQLYGRDIHLEFVEAARARIALTAIERGQWPSNALPLALATLLPNIKVGDGLNVCAEGLTHIVMNPPYTKIETSEQCEWKSGKVNAAAVFVEKFILTADEGTRFTASLPEVLCSGSSYEKWRAMVSTKLNFHALDKRGRFDGFADVDVFVLDATVIEEGQSFTDWWRFNNDQEEGTTIGDLFEVRVGPVVPHRDEEKGKMYSFIHAKNAPPWKEIKKINESRKYYGRVFDPPFVVVRRTSSPSDAFRVIASIVLGERPVAVENHLLVLKPNEGGLELCYQAVKKFRSDNVNQWMNERIGCRHLTVSAMSELPWKDESDE